MHFVTDTYEKTALPLLSSAVQKMMGSDCSPGPSDKGASAPLIGLNTRNRENSVPQPLVNALG